MERETQGGISNSTTEAINQGITLSVCFNMAPIASSACGKTGKQKQTTVDLKNRRRLNRVVWLLLHLSKSSKLDFHTKKVF
jgi:hypothetical protein